MTTDARLETLADVAERADYSLLDTLNADPDSSETGDDHDPRQVFSGHYVPVTPTPLPDPEYVVHSESLFAELGFADALSRTADFAKFFSGDLATAPDGLKRHGWATGYALSIYGQEMVQQCPFRTGNGYGDGRALSVLEGEFAGRRWEMQLKGAGRTPYCRGGDGRAVLRSSVREFLAQEHMHALGVPTSRSLSLFVSRSEQIRRPWYSEDSTSTDPDRWVWDPAAISTRVAPSFLRVGQLELFARRARKQEHPRAMQELEMLLHHVVDREYSEISKDLAPAEQFIELATAFRDRLTTLVAHWIRVGYCQGNFNSDNCALGGFTLDYGPFGFMELFEPAFQPWTGGGRHFCFFNQPAAAEQNFEMFMRSVLTWDGFDEAQRTELHEVRRDFGLVMRDKLDQVWQDKLGLPSREPALVRRLLALMVQTPLDYTVFFRELSEVPSELTPLKTSFYPVREPVDETEWSAWLADWHSIVLEGRSEADVRRLMKSVNPKYILREWHLVPAYQDAAKGDYARVRALQAVMTRPHDDQPGAAEFYALRPLEHFGKGGICHMSCSS